MTSGEHLSESFLNSAAISDDFFIEIVENKLKISKDEFKLRLVLLSPATGNNENYMSVLYRAKIKIEILATKSRQSVDVIVKALLMTEGDFKILSVFSRERLVYENILRSFENIWLDRAGEEVHFGPQSYKFETDPYEIIVLEDLKTSSYQMLERKVGLSVDESKIFLAKLAKFHAASAIRYQKDGLIDKQFDRKRTITPENNSFAFGLQMIYNKFLSSIKDYGDCDIYADKIARWDLSKFAEGLNDFYEPMPSGFQVLNHGDPWLNNLMFKHDEANNPIDVLMVDFQLSCWASPIGELLYFLLTSVADDVKVSQFDDFVAFYHKELTDSLQKLKYDQNIPSLNELNNEMRAKAHAATLIYVIILFVVKYDSDGAISMETVMRGKDKDMIDRIYNNSCYKNAIKLWLPFLNERGFLDALILT